MFSEGEGSFAGSPFARYHRRHGTSWLHGCRVCPQEFTGFLQKHDEVLTELEKATKRLKKLETVYKEFELQKVCYLPLNTFLLKPIQRLMHYKLILERLCKHYTPAHRDLDDCKGQCAAHQELVEGGKGLVMHRYVFSTCCRAWRAFEGKAAVISCV